MSESEVKQAWDRHWIRGSIEENASWVGKRLRHRRLQIMREMLAPLSKSLKVVDLGSGNGSTLQVLRDTGFWDSIGLEYTERGLEASEKVNGFRRGVDVFMGDAGKTGFPKGWFGLVYSEGLWEHFENPEPYMDEFIRISNRYIMVIQPNHFSLAGRALKIGWDIFNSKKGGVKEYSFKLSYFIDYLAERGFDLKEYRSTRFNEQAVLLFMKREAIEEEIIDKNTLWDRYYQHYTPTKLGKMMYNAHRKILGKVLSRLLPDKNTPILDVGCGKGSTLTSLRNWGYKNSVGIDLSEVGLKSCVEHGYKLGLDVIKMDATNMTYKDREFPVVFSEGMLEHYTNFNPFVDEMTRVSSHYIILVQPNHDTLYSKIIQWGWKRFRKNSGGVEELDHHLEEYYRSFEARGYKTLSVDFTPLKENAVIVFERNTV